MVSLAANDISLEVSRDGGCGANFPKHSWLIREFALGCVCLHAISNVISGFGDGIVYTGRTGEGDGTGYCRPSVHTS